MQPCYTYTSVHVPVICCCHLFTICYLVTGLYPVCCPGPAPAIHIAVAVDLAVWSGSVIWSCIRVRCILSSGPGPWSCILFLLSGQMHLVRALLYISRVYLLANLIRWVFDNICVRKMIITLMLYNMLGKRDYFKTHEIEAFEIAERIIGNKYDDSRHRTQHIAAEANLILEEWWHDYRNEHV